MSAQLLAAVPMARMIQKGLLVIGEALRASRCTLHIKGSMGLSMPPSLVCCALRVHEILVAFIRRG